jgi:hypothetical protein
MSKSHTQTVKTKKILTTEKKDRIKSRVKKYTQKDKRTGLKVVSKGTRKRIKRMDYKSCQKSHANRQD